MGGVTGNFLKLTLNRDPFVCALIVCLIDLLRTGWPHLPCEGCQRPGFGPQTTKQLVGPVCLLREPALCCHDPCAIILGFISFILAQRVVTFIFFFGFGLCMLFQDSDVLH